MIVLVLFVVIFGTIYGALFFASSQTKNDVMRLVQKQCGASSASVEVKTVTDAEATVTYVDGTGAHTAIVRIGTRRSYFLATCGR